jgi:hypothetical protein
MLICLLLISLLFIPASTFAQSPQHKFSYWELSDAAKKNFRGKTKIIDACVILQLDKLTTRGAVTHVHCGWVAKDGTGAAQDFQPLQGQQVQIEGDAFIPLALIKGDPTKTLLEQILSIAYPAVTEIMSQNGTPDDPTDDLDYSGTLKSQPLPVLPDPRTRDPGTLTR